MPKPCDWSCEEVDGEFVFRIWQYGHGVSMTERDARRFADFVLGIKPREDIEHNIQPEVDG